MTGNGIKYIGLTKSDSNFKNYCTWLEENKLPYIILDWETNNFDDIKKCSSLLMTGGADIFPEFYNDWEDGKNRSDYIPARDGFEFKLLEFALENNYPILGICRGLQVINCKLKGSLINDIETIRGTNHRKISNIEDRMHNVNIKNDSLLYDLVKKDKAIVNSSHHQAIDRIGEGLMISAKADDGIIEALEWDDKAGKPFLIAVQWHPERMPDKNMPVSKNIIEKFREETNKIKHFNVLIFLFLITSFIFNACSGSSGKDGLDRLPVKEIKNKVNRNSSLIETMEASGNISFDSPEQSGTGWIEIKIKKPDTVYVRIEGPFGISIANALITRYDFIYYNAQENKAILGPSNDINIGAILRIKVTFDELLNGFTGGFNFNEDSTDTSMAESENGFYTFKSNKDPGVQKFYIDPEKYTVQKYNSLDEQNNTVVEVNYTNYFEENASGKSVYFPSNIKIKNPGKNQSVYVDYVNKEFNKSDITFKIKIPKSAKVIKWN